MPTQTGHGAHTNIHPPHPATHTHKQGREGGETQLHVSRMTRISLKMVIW